MRVPKKPTVKPEQRQEWLRRRQDGESPPKIAKKDGYDVRTVRKYLELAGQEKEMNEARASVLRNALERHYQDLCDHAKRLGGEKSEPYDEALEAALRQHLRRSPIWGYLKQKERLQTAITEVKREIGSKIEEGVASDPQLQKTLTTEENGVVPGVIAALSNQAEFWAQSLGGLNPQDNLKSEQPQEDFVHLWYGRFGLGIVRKSHIDLIAKVLTDWKLQINKWEEYKQLEKLFLDLSRTNKNLNDEITTIVLRRIVPGRCRYCPL